MQEIIKRGKPRLNKHIITTTTKKKKERKKERKEIEILKQETTRK